MTPERAKEIAEGDGCTFIEQYTTGFRIGRGSGNYAFVSRKQLMHCSEFMFVYAYMPTRQKGDREALRPKTAEECAKLPECTMAQYVKGVGGFVTNNPTTKAETCKVFANGACWLIVKAWGSWFKVNVTAMERGR